MHSASTSISHPGVSSLCPIASAFLGVIQAAPVAFGCCRIYTVFYLTVSTLAGYISVETIRGVFGIESVLTERGRYGKARGVRIEAEGCCG